jgi:heme/copper-type cytochrome/quinol oxidase subunit 1
VRRALPGIVAGLGVVLVLTGIAVFAAANRGAPPDFGWSSYAPLTKAVGPYQSGITFSDGAVLWTGEHLLGAGLVVLGGLALAGTGGWLLGRRSGRRTVPPT